MCLIRLSYYIIQVQYGPLKRSEETPPPWCQEPIHRMERNRRTKTQGFKIQGLNTATRIHNRCQPHLIKSRRQYHVPSQALVYEGNPPYHVHSFSLLPIPYVLPERGQRRTHRHHGVNIHHGWNVQGVRSISKSLEPGHRHPGPIHHRNLWHQHFATNPH